MWCDFLLLADLLIIGDVLHQILKKMNAKDIKRQDVIHGKKMRKRAPSDQMLPIFSSVHEILSTENVSSQQFIVFLTFLDF